MPNNYNLLIGLKTAWKDFRKPELIKWSALMVVLLLVFEFILISNVILSRGEPLWFILSLFLCLVLMLFLGFYAAPRMQAASMKAGGVKVAKKIPNPFEWLIFNLKLLFVNVFSWYDKRLFVPVLVLIIIALLVALIGIVEKTFFIIAFALGIFTIFVWIFICIIHSWRTQFASYMYLRGDGHGMNMPKKSFKLVKGQTLEVFLADYMYSSLIFNAFQIVFYALFLVLGIVMFATMGIIAVAEFATSGQLLDLSIFGMGLLLAIPVAIAGTYAFAYFMALRANFFSYFDSAGAAKKEGWEEKIKIFEQNESEFNVLKGMRTSAEGVKQKDVLVWSAGFVISAILLFAAISVVAFVGAAVTGGVGAAAWLLLVILAGAIAFILLAGYAVPRVLQACMKAVEMKVGKKVPNISDTVFLLVKLFFVNLLCWYDKKLLAPAVALILLAILCAIIGFFAEINLMTSAGIGILIIAFLA
ncbi:MAG: hypothetical protein ABIH83_05510, partial [Candidatus Micrarchaeota archaeon]